MKNQTVISASWLVLAVTSPLVVAAEALQTQNTAQTVSPAQGESSAVPSTEVSPTNDSVIQNSAASEATPKKLLTTANEQPEETLTIYSKRGLISYVSATASKDNTPIVETPMSVSVLTSERIKAIGAETIQDALGYVAGVYNGPFGVDTRGDWSAIRGVSPVQYLDGMKMLYGHYNNTRPNPYGLAQIEILKGPASVLYGQGTTGGIVNLVSRKPQATTEGEFWAQLGNFDRTQLAIDYTGALDSDASFLFRINGMYRDSGTQTDHVADNTRYFAPALTWHINADTEWTLLANIQQNESGSSTQFFPHVGTIIPAPLGQIPANRFVSEPDFDKYNTDQQAITSIIKHDINPTWQIRSAIRYMDSSADYYTMYAYPFNLQSDNTHLLRSIYVSQADAKSLTTDNRLHAQFAWGNSEHQLVIGYDLQDATTNNDSYFGFNAGGLLNVYQPEYGQTTIPPIAQLPIADSPKLKTRQSGIYIQDQIKIDEQWIVSLGARRDRATTQTIGSDQQKYTATTKRFGLMYLTHLDISPYFSYSESFDIINGLNANQQPYQPKQGKQNEWGLKYQPANTEHLITASYFQSKEKNRLVADPQNPTQQIQIGEAKISGYEVEAQLEWDNLDVYANYSQIDTRDEFAEKLNSIPEQMVSTWVTYQPTTFWQGIKIGAGIRYVGNTFFKTNINNQPTPTETDSYTLIDFMLGYAVKPFDLTLNVDNITDKTVITTCLNRGDCFYGQSRTISANIRYQF
ncbi:TonB-dependent siderophore receptor [Aliikangiella maris]|uniref:TonB-dependent siderophore receptor n=2 Tax=Aliikangiella maris TaxID=3162458 RepID=A0ABV3MT02_9GAMM